MSGVLIAPPWVKCEHAAPALKWSFVPPERLSVWCRGCNQVWDENTVPFGVIDTLTELLDQRRFVQINPRRAHKR